MNEGTGVLKFFDVQGPSTEPLMQVTHHSWSQRTVSGFTAFALGSCILVKVSLGMSLCKLFVGLMAQIGVAPEASVTQVLWHPRIKQVVCGNSTGGAKILYNPAFSVKGALLVSQDRKAYRPTPGT